jgi:hypothetical protein
LARDLAAAENFISRHLRGLLASLTRPEPGRRARNRLALAVVALAPVLAVITVIALGDTEGSSLPILSTSLRWRACWSGASRR